MVKDFKIEKRSFEKNMSTHYDVSEIISLLNEAGPLSQEKGQAIFDVCSTLLKYYSSPEQEQGDEPPRFHRTKEDKKSGKKIFYTLKEDLPEDSGALKTYPSGDFPWDPAFNGESHNVPRGKVHEFCPTSRKIPEEEFKEMSARGNSKLCDYYECRCT